MRNPVLPVLEQKISAAATQYCREPNFYFFLKNFVKPKRKLFEQHRIRDPPKHSCLLLCPFIRPHIYVINVVNIPMLAKLKLSASNCPEALEVFARRFV